MGFKESVVSCFSQYVGFSGRARRSEYWYWVLFTLIVNVILNVIKSVSGVDAVSFVMGIFSLAIFLPSLAACMRRLHDIGKSGAWVLLSFIPLIGQIILLIWYCQDSQPGSNQYGPNPKTGEMW